MGKEDCKSVPDSDVCCSGDLIPPLVRLFLRQDFAKIDPELPCMLDILNEVGAAECWHKKSTFKAHLFEVYKICKIWGASDAIARCGLMHSAYSNSFVNLAIFKPDVERSRVAKLIGSEAEELTHLFCVVPRQQLLQVQLLDRLPLGTADLHVPPDGLTVSHIRTGQPLAVDVYHLGVFLLLTMADFAEQLYSWQDVMFGNTDGRLRLEGCPAPQPAVLWPGDMRPGLWVSAVSRMGRLLVDCKLKLEAAGDPRAHALALPPVFNTCSAILDEDAQLEARDAYWRGVCALAEGPDGGAEGNSSSSSSSSSSPAAAAAKTRVAVAATALARAAELNPFVAEPRLMLAQLAAHAGEWATAQSHASAALQLFVEWGTAWDKRMHWDAWVAWTRVVLEAAAAQQWPSTPLGIVSLGLVRGL